MPPQPLILDSHIHLWPATATSTTDHAWMTPGFFLAKRHGVRDYDEATSSSSSSSIPPSSEEEKVLKPAAFVYVETDRYLPSPLPEFSGVKDGVEGDEIDERLRDWARAPLEELGFLRRVVEGGADEGEKEADGAVGGDGDGEKRMVGCVIWMPFLLDGGKFARYASLARKTMGERGWGRVVGFRYLLQGRTAAEVRSIIHNGSFVENVKTACEQGEKKLAFDVGIDVHRDGVETLDAALELVEVAGDGVTFVLNHLCKPDLSSSTWSGYQSWHSAISKLSAHPNVYMKFSGALNEFAPSATPSAASDVLAALRSHLDHVLESFGARRMMFGSDWPVCNVGGPKGESGNWGLWAEVVEAWLEEKNISEEDRAWIWAKTAASAYGIDEFR